MPTFSNSAIEKSYLTDPRLALIKSLQESSGNTAPAQGGWGEGLARIAGGAIAGMQGKQLRKDYEAKDAAARKALQDALSGQTKEDRVKGLGQVPGYDGVAVEASLQSPDFSDLVNQAFIKQASGVPLTPEEAAAGRAYDLKEGAKIQIDPRGNSYTPYRPVFGGSKAGAVPPTSLGGAGPTLQLRQDGSAALLPPPSGEGQPDTSLMQVPSGLDPKAQGVFMDEVARTAAEKAANGGMPKMTEAQGQAASRATLIEGGLKGMSDVLLKPTVSGANMAIADTVGKAGPIGEFLGNQIRSPDEQRFAANKAAVLEGFASAVTGAGVTQDQFTRFSNLLPTGSEDPAVQREKLANAYNFLLTQTKIAGPIAEEIRAEAERLRNPEGGQGGLTPEEQRELEELEKMFGGQQ